MPLSSNELLLKVGMKVEELCNLDKVTDSTFFMNDLASALNSS